MARQTHAQKAQAKQEAKTEEVEAAKLDTPVADETDDLLADIDDVLEENAEQFVKGFIQKGGE